MELYQLRQFQAAARHKNMTRAAGELCIAQPALSKTIHKLEEEFGAQLFIRNKKGLECTRQGEILLEYADRILALSEDAARAVSESLGDAGEIRLCLRSSAVLVSNVLKDFIHEHPHVSFSISSEPKGCDLLIDSVSSAYDIPDNAHLAYSCNDYILQGKLISLGLGVSFVASVTWTSSSLPENISLLHIDDCPHFRSIYYQPLGSFCSENQRIFEHQLEEYFKNLNN